MNMLFHTIAATVLVAVTWAATMFVLAIIGYYVVPFQMPLWAAALLCLWPAVALVVHGERVMAKRWA